MSELDDEDVAIIFKLDGSIELMVPTLYGPNYKGPIPEHVLAATEALLRTQEDRAELANAFLKRAKKAS